MMSFQEYESEDEYDDMEWLVSRARCGRPGYMYSIIQRCLLLNTVGGNPLPVATLEASQGEAFTLSPRNSMR